jgi:hypothetical protein
MRESIKGFDRYQRRVYTAEKSFVLRRRGSERVIEQADEFYIRQATSSPGYRVVFVDSGPTIIYTVGNDETHTNNAQRLLANSMPAED